MNPTHDWHVADGMELVIRRDEEDSVGVHLGHENIDDSHGTVIITSRLLEMIDSVQPGAIRDYLAAQEPTDADDLVTVWWTDCDCEWMTDYCAEQHHSTARIPRAALSAAHRARGGAA